jgi:hypothetical protein
MQLQQAEARFDCATFYGGGERGFTDYPVFAG